MTENEISMLAFKQDPMPGDATWTDKMLYSYLRILYKYRECAAITSDRGKELKGEFVSLWDNVNIKLDTLTKIAEHDAGKWLRLEPINHKWAEAAEKYASDKNAENADELIKIAEEFRKEVYVG